MLLFLKARSDVIYVPTYIGKTFKKANIVDVFYFSGKGRAQTAFCDTFK